MSSPSYVTVSGTPKCHHTLVWDHKWDAKMCQNVTFSSLVSSVRSSRITMECAVRTPALLHKRDTKNSYRRRALLTAASRDATAHP